MIHSKHEIKRESIQISGTNYPLYRFNTIIIGSGCAGFNAADSLFSLGQTDIAIITEGLNMGTSRNTGSDKQTYYKLSTSGDNPDSVMSMAEDLHTGGMNGDNALAEAACSLGSFYKLVNIGVPFPYNEFGEYVGYQTDHDKHCRATSCGPLTSKYMTERLEAQVFSKDIPVFDGYRVVKLLVQNGSMYGAIALDASSKEAHGITLFLAEHIIYATGGPSGMYAQSVYPESQTCAHGAAFEAGAEGANLHLFQFGIASVGFRWNLSGSYQQVIPRYISRNTDGGDEREFLNDWFSSEQDMLGAIFLKGFQWPFDSSKLGKTGSSIIDLAVYRETRDKNRIVYLDFTKNPSGYENIEQMQLPKTAKAYLENSGALGDTPIARLLKLNKRAYDIYFTNGCDLAKEPLRIDVCVQHNNGGLKIDSWSESNIKEFFVAGEAAGVFGAIRPGGSALNSTQVTSLRAAQAIIKRKNTAKIINVTDIQSLYSEAISEVIRTIETISSKENDNVILNRRKYQKRMSDNCAIIWDYEKIARALEECSNDLNNFNSETFAGPERIIDAFINRDILISQFVYLSAAKHYLETYGASVGSCLIPESNKPADLIAVSETRYNTSMHSCIFNDTHVREIPKNRELWFENVYNHFKK